MNRPSKVTVSVVATLLIAGAIAGVAAASVHSRPSIFYGCESATGSVSAISTSSQLRCPGATRVRWNATGPRGAAGSPGATGAAGAAGSPGATGAAGAAGSPGATGVAGAMGSPGAPGVRGSLWSTGSGAPTATGLNGDLYLDTATGNVYELVTGSWTMEANITGPQGPNGVVRDCSLTPYPGIDLAGCSLSISPFTDYSEANLSGVSMVNNIIDGDNFTNANLTGANLQFVDNGGTAANFTNANLTGVNLGGAYLASSNFTNANLSGANLDLAFAFGATGFATALYNDTTCPDATVVSTPNTCVGHEFP
jgi:hypothetical protein